MIPAEKTSAKRIANSLNFMGVIKPLKNKKRKRLKN
tara:strand:+ start:118 stop:225 length:108 start_codon:yes stop_codon:yes gene_type:complete